MIAIVSEYSYDEFLGVFDCEETFFQYLLNIGCNVKLDQDGFEDVYNIETSDGEFFDEVKIVDFEINKLENMKYLLDNSNKK